MDNPKLEQELWDSPEFRIAIRDAAVEAKNYANAFIREGHHNSGPVSWMPRKGHGNQPVDVVQDDGGKNVYLVNFDYAGAMQEWGSKNNPIIAPLRRGVRAAGLELREAPK